MKKTLLLGALVLGLLPATVASAQCAEALKKGTSFQFTTAAADGGKIASGTVKVTKNDGSFVEFLVTTGKQKMTMPGGIDGANLILTNPKNGTVWVAKCTDQGLEGISNRAGKSQKLTVQKK